jgi:eukaryotic-like serine/threonine-protein kinase
LSAPKLKGRYEILEELGAGGMGAVYRAYDKVIKAEVALKTLLDISDPAALKMFREECDKLARMVHPNIVEIRDIGEFDSGKGKQPYLVMPLLRGATLDQLIKKSSQFLPVERAVDILCQACRGLQAAHEAGLVHRDIKPSNIFVMDDDSVKLIDFGVAHVSENGLTVGQKGTLLYMSPEQLEMKGISALSDIFSLGVVAFQCMTGQSPFKRRTEEEVVNAILTYAPPPASEHNPAVSQLLSQAVHKAMAKQPFHRYRSAREFGDTLQKALHQQPIEMFNTARIQPRIERANQVLEKGDLELAAEIIGELDAEGHLDPQVSSLRRKVEQMRRQKRISHLLDSARTRLEEKEYPLALQNIQEALGIDKADSDALALKEMIEARRAEQSITDWLQLARQHVDNFAYDRARDALQNVLQLKPNDTRAVTLLAEVERRKTEHRKLSDEKETLHRAAEEAFGRGDVSSALSKMGRVLELDKQAPNRSNPDRGTHYQSLYNQIRSAHDAMQMAYSEARTLQSSGNYVRALELCNENLKQYPSHALFQALKLDLEVAHRQQLSAYIAEIDRRVEKEPDLDKRLDALKEAMEKFPEVEHFRTNYRLARDKRDLIESIASKAHVLEEKGQFAESLAQWEILQSIYDRYPGLAFEFERLKKRRDQQARSESRARWIEQIDQSIDANDYAKALSLVESAKVDFPGDGDLNDLEAIARKGEARIAEARTLLDNAKLLQSAGRVDEATETLERAVRLDRANPAINEALQSLLLDRVRATIDRDWRAAEALLKRAQDLGSGHFAIRGLLRAVQDKRTDEEAAEVIEKARNLQAAGDIPHAYRLVGEKLKECPGHPELQQTYNRIAKAFDASRKQDLDGVQQIVAEGQRRSDAEFLRTMIDRTNAIVSRYPGDDEFSAIQNRARNRLQELQVEESGFGAAETQPVLPKGSKAPAIPKKAVAGNPFDLKRFQPSLLSNKKIVAGVCAAAVLLVGYGIYQRAKPPRTDPGKIVQVQPPPPPSKSILTVKTNPPGARLLINGSQEGSGNGSDLTLNPGKATIQATLPGYKPVTRDEELTAGARKSVEISLELLDPAIRVDTPMATGSATLDGKAIGELQGGQLTLDPAPEGGHTIQIKGDQSLGFAFQSAKEGIEISNISAGMAGSVMVVESAGGRTKVICNRSGLVLNLDDRSAGPCLTKDPTPVELPPGPHTLEAVDGKQSLGKKNIEIGPATATAIFILGISDEGMLVVQADQDDFTVTFDGYQSKIPSRRGVWKKRFSPGDHTVSVYKDGFTANPPEAKISIKKGTDLAQLFSFVAVPKSGSLHIKTMSGADVSVGGGRSVKADADGNADFPALPLGPITITVTKKGYASATRQAQIGPGRNAPDPISLQAEQVAVSVTVKPAGAQAQVVLTPLKGGAPHSSRAPLTANLPDGDYKLEVTATGYQSKTESVKLFAGEPFNRDIVLDETKKDPVPQPVSKSVKTWTGWEDGGDDWQNHGQSDFAPAPASATPSRITFTANWERTKGAFGKSRKGSLQWIFRSGDATSSVRFKLDDNSLSWERRENNQKTGSGNVNHPLQVKGAHSVAIDCLSRTMKITVDGIDFVVDVDVSGLFPVKFGFKVDSGETLSVKNFSSSSR